jgi:hypothetical protein
MAEFRVLLIYNSYYSQTRLQNIDTTGNRKTAVRKDKEGLYLKLTESDGNLRNTQQWIRKEVAPM